MTPNPARCLALIVICVLALLGSACGGDDGAESGGGDDSGAVTQPKTAGGDRIPNGTYECKMWMGSSYVSLGTVRSVNNSLDTALLAKVGATFTGASATASGVTISYTTARGYRESMDCTRK